MISNGVDESLECSVTHKPAAGENGLVGFCNLLLCYKTTVQHGDQHSMQNFYNYTRVVLCMLILVLLTSEDAFEWSSKLPPDHPGLQNCGALVKVEI